VPYNDAPTIADVARVAGVSQSTASRAFTSGASPAARARVQAAARELGYTPNPVARALANGSGLRLVVAVQGASPDQLQDPYTNRVVGAIANVVSEHGMGVSTCWLPRDHSGRQLLDDLGQDRTVCGVVLVNTTEEVLTALPASLNGRVASIGIGGPGVPSFDVDNAGAASAILRHLYETGRRRIVMITGPAWLPCAARPVTVYRELMTAAGVPVRIVEGDFSGSSGRAAVAEILRRWPDTDAVYAISDAPALGVMAALHERRVQVPGDIAVAGFDDVPLAELSTPGLTTASHPVERIAAAAATAVLEKRAAPALTTFPSQLIRRASA
jgi:DNA-binding LacI/PurR family transcriptional regulator